MESVKTGEIGRGTNWRFIGNVKNKDLTPSFSSPYRISCLGRICSPIVSLLFVSSTK
jgi:hypothetical protein